LWTREALGRNARITGAFDLAVRIVTAAYVLMTAWQVAKALNPPLKVWQDTTAAALRQRLQRPSAGLPELGPADRAAIYDDTRL
jgi:hypothetical protein